LASTLDRATRRGLPRRHRVSRASAQRADPGRGAGQAPTPARLHHARRLFRCSTTLLAVLYAHPQVHVDVGVIVFIQPRPAFYRYLQGIVDAGFGSRVMFGIGPDGVGRASSSGPWTSSKRPRSFPASRSAPFSMTTRRDSSD
jgi:hypothetical protein